MSEAKGPLSGIRVFDATLIMVGPWCTMQLGALGADVIHIESPEFAQGHTSSRRAGQSGGGGRAGRNAANPLEPKNPQTLPLEGVPPSMFGTSIGYLMWNLNKRGIVLDYKDPDDLAFAYELVKTCDVLVQNMRTGVMDRLGLGYEKLRQINPKLVYCSISGWGSRGPMATISAADPMIQTGSGWTSVNGPDADRWESYRHVTQLDANTGNHAAQAIIAALLAREKTGKGQLIEISMLEAAASLQTSRLAEYIATGNAPRPMGSAVPTVVPDEAFKCEEGDYVAVTVNTDAQWQAMCSALDLEDLAADDSLADNAGRVAARERVVQALRAKLATKPVYWWVHLLNRAGVPATRRMRFDELRYHPQVTANRYILSIPTRHWGDIYVGGPPWHFSETPERCFEPPYPGDHQDEVRADVSRELSGRVAANSAAVDGGITLEQPLAGLTVVDLSQGRSGPHITMLAAAAGARVIKVEPPQGDYLRRQGPPFIGGDAAAFVLLNAGKQGIAIDPDNARDVHALQALLARADAVIEDWGGDYSRALDFDYTSLRRSNPRAVCLSVTNWGESGPWTLRPQSDLTAQFASEVTTSLGRPEEPPVRVGASIGEAYVGVFGFQALCAAFYARAKTSLGQQVFLSKFGGLLFMRGTLWTAHSNPDGWYGFHLENYLTAPNYVGERALRCKDALITFSPRFRDAEQLRAFCDRLSFDFDLLGAIPEGAMGGPAQMDRPEVRAFFQGIVADKESVAVSAATDELFGGGAFPLHDYDTLMHSPQADAVTLSQDVYDPGRGTYSVVAAPWTFEGSGKRVPSPAPGLDQHRAEVLETAGLTPDVAVGS